MAHSVLIRVYYEDTDAAGIVYYANYLKFIERGRSEWVRGLGIDQARLLAEAGIGFAVRRIEADYLRPARLDDLLEVRTALRALGGARIELEQEVWHGEVRLFAALVTLVAMRVAVGEAGSGGAVRLPDALRAQLQG